MKIIYFSGNFGNQIFYCAFKNFLVRKHRGERVFYAISHLCPPIKVEQLTSLELPIYNSIINVICNFIVLVDLILRKFGFKLPTSLICGEGNISENSIVFSNYLQNKYFYSDLDSSWLEIKEPQNLSDEYIKFKKDITGSDAICIHIRRGDYVNNPAFVDLSSTNYYQQAIQQARNIYPQGKLFFFSDDLDFVKTKFKGEDCFYVDCNRGENSYLDMKLMSLAKVNIIANSTFSYWGAYINHEHKVVYCPSKWFKVESHFKDPDIFLDNWIRVKI